MKQQINAVDAKIKWFISRINHYQQNRMFVNNPGRFFQRLNNEEENHQYEIPNSVEAQTFWMGIWSKRKEHHKDAEWLKDVKELEQDEGRDKIDLTKDKMMRVMRKMPNWKAPGLDKVQGYWLKNLTPLHEKLVVYLQECLDSGVVPEWLTKRRTVLIQKDKAKGNIASNYQPIARLPLVWKLLIGRYQMKSMIIWKRKCYCQRNRRGVDESVRGQVNFCLLTK